MTTKPTIIFDFDGTLANTLELVAKIYNEHAEDFGARQVDLAEIAEYRRLGYKGAMKKAGIRWTVLPRLVLFISREMKAQMSVVKPYDGIVSVLSELQKNNISIGVLTSNDAELVAEFFRAHKFPHFDFIVSEKTMFGKEKALRKIMKRHQLKTNDVIYVGDEPRDVSASKRAKIRVVGVSWGFGGTEGFKRAKPTYQVSTPDELLKLLLSL